MNAFVCLVLIGLAGVTQDLWAEMAKEIPVHLTEGEKNTIRIFRNSASQVVNISRTRYARRSLFSLDLDEVQAGSGSGFVWDRQGHVVTNFHVINQAEKLSVSFADGTSISASIKGVEPRKDIAVLKLKSTRGLRLKGLPLAPSGGLLVGQIAIAIGSPFGLDQTLTKGVISALGRSMQGFSGLTIRDMVQTDASINPGNSGGPLLDSAGRVIGMNTMILSQDGASVGVGFAVPSDTIKRIVNQLIRFGKVRQPGLGISAFADDKSRDLGVSGVIIRSVIPGTGAADAGMRGTQINQEGRLILGDIIVAIDADRVMNFDDLYNSLESRKVGDKVKVIALRDGQKITFRVRLSLINDD